MEDNGQGTQFLLILLKKNSWKTEHSHVLESYTSLVKHNMTTLQIQLSVLMSKEGQLTWVTQILYIPFSLSMSFSDGFSVVCPISKPPRRGRGKMDVENKISTLVIPLTQVLMSPIVTLIPGTHPVEIYLQVSVS